MYHNSIYGKWIRRISGKFLEWILRTSYNFLLCEPLPANPEAFNHKIPSSKPLSNDKITEKDKIYPVNDPPNRHGITLSSVPAAILSAW